VSASRPGPKDGINVNDYIRADPIRLIDENGEQVGVVPLRVAMARASDAGLDLVEISPNASPPVCKILDYGKYRFELQKKAAEARKKQHTADLKEITLRPGTEEHDYQVKLRKIQEFLTDGDKVKISIRFRGREITHQENGMAILKRIEQDVAALGKVDQSPRMEGRNMQMVVSPLTKK
jgi:translation initiation factor IF-3